MGGTAGGGAAGCSLLHADASARATMKAQEGLMKSEPFFWENCFRWIIGRIPRPFEYHFDFALKT
jgi:hypothetical protein